MSDYASNEKGAIWALRYWRMHGPRFKRLTMAEFERLSQEERMAYLIEAMADLRERFEERN